MYLSKLISQSKRISFLCKVYEQQEAIGTQIYNLSVKHTSAVKWMLSTTLSVTVKY